MNDNIISLNFTVYGDWGLGIGDWAQSPIPNPQSPKFEFIKLILFDLLIFIVSLDWIYL